MSLFAPYRALGIVCNNVPISGENLGNDDFLTCAVGDTFHVYNAKKLKLANLGQSVASKIQLIASKQTFTAAYHNQHISLWKRNELTSSIIQKSKVLKLKFIELKSVGDFHGSKTIDENSLFLLCLKTDQLEIYDNSLKLSSVLKLPHKSSCVETLYGHKDKILIGFENGVLILYKIFRQKPIFVFNADNLSNNSVNSVLKIKSSQVKNVVSVGYKNGKIEILNLKQNVVLTDFLQTNGAITDLEFSRKDEKGILATSSTSGCVNVWDLEEKNLNQIIKKAHLRTISSIYFLEDLKLVTASNDNSLKIWKIDVEDQTAICLKSRSGHYLPLSFAQFYGEKGTDIISAGCDRALRRISVIRDEQNVEFSQGKLDKLAKNTKSEKERLKLPIALDMCTSQAKERQWWNIITCHEKSNKAITWSFENKAMNKKKLSLKEKTIITTVSVSVCGNLCVIGTQSGNIYKFNMESSHFREKFIDENIGKSAHAGAIFGLCFESFNKTLISGATDSIIKVWNFEEARILRFLELRSPITKMKLHLETNLLGVTTNDFEITLIDISNMKMVREFETHFSRISDFTFHPNGRWLITTTTNGIVRVFDILSNILIDWFEFEDPPTSINFSPDERFLMTTHANSLAVHLWINKSHFMHLPTNSVNKNVPPKRFFLKAGNFSHFEEVDGKLTELDRNLLWNKNESNKDGDKNQNSNKENNQNKYDKNENKVLKKEKNSEIENLVVFSNSAKIDKWANLAFYDLIKERNRPIEPVKKMENAPFFLASLEDYNKNDEIEENDDLNKNISKFSDNKLIKILRRCEKITNYKEALEYLKKTNISKIDLDFQFIEEEEEIELFLKFFISLTNKFAHFEVVQSCLNLFFKTHSKEISRADSKLLVELSKNMNLISERLEDDVDETLCLLADVINSKN